MSGAPSTCRACTFFEYDLHCHVLYCRWTRIYYYNTCTILYIIIIILTSRPRRFICSSYNMGFDKLNTRDAVTTGPRASVLVHRCCTYIKEYLAITVADRI